MKLIEVLLADDHQIVLDGIQAFLEKETEIKVVAEANNGEQVLKFLQKQPVDVVVLDIGMPELNGLDTAKQILRQYPKTKVLMLTVEGEGRFIVNAMKLGVHGYILKEKSKETLVGAIHCVYRGSTYWPPDIFPRIVDLKDDDDDQDPQFTERETEVLCLMTTNPSLTSQELGRELNIARETVDTHVRNMKGKLKVKKRGELVAYALKNGLCE